MTHGTALVMFQQSDIKRCHNRTENHERLTRQRNEALSLRILYLKWISWRQVLVWHG